MPAPPAKENEKRVAVMLDPSQQHLIPNPVGAPDYGRAMAQLIIVNQVGTNLGTCVKMNSDVVQIVAVGVIPTICIMSRNIKDSAFSKTEIMIK